MKNYLQHKHFFNLCVEQSGALLNCSVHLVFPEAYYDLSL